MKLWNSTYSVIVDILQYEEVTTLLHRIASLSADEERIQHLKQGQTVTSTSSKKTIVEGNAECSAIGKRKASLAKVSVRKGVGNFDINSRHLLDYFPRLADRKQVLFPLSVTGCLGKFDVSIKVKGGGLTGKTGSNV